MSGPVYQYRGFEIRTSFDYPPIPTRELDWSAWVDGREEWKTGRGPTEVHAVIALIEDIEESGA
ncbi:hypothetical protein UFOVP130_13 [uncultured Caudovirales phage]|uniref:Uncharacterized protein n=1 Tax=uncultured Caudovirales phage TaxID=2100421 RepID=A0A6J5L956_9CAUD|nr:hypothetical protein UFOVP130_13 [uncultured Caudovirales phage]